MDRELVVRAQQGDRDAFARLASGTVDRLYGIARMILRDTDRAEDAVQETLVLSWRQLPSLRDPERFEAWQRRILLRAVVDEQRRGRRFDDQVRVLHLEPSERDGSATVADRDELERGLRALSADHRAVLVLRYYVGLSVPEIAEAIGVPEGTAKSRLHHATEAMRAALASVARGIPSTGITA